MLKPFPEYLIVFPDPHEEETQSGLVEPEKMSDTPLSGILEACGQKTFFYDLYTDTPNRPSTRIWFKMWAGTDITFEGITYKVLHINDCIAYEEL